MPRLIDTSLIKKFEGCKLESYLCPNGVMTIGFGSTYLLNGSRVPADLRINYPLAERMLEKHIQTEIIDRLDEQLLNSLTDKQLSALCSLIYRIGITKFNRSKLKKAILKQDYKLINNNWDWLGKNKAIHRGLCLRVSEEKAVFFSDKFK
jgi:lysozyme